MQNLTKAEVQAEEDLRTAKESYAKAIQKESTFESLNPKESELKLNIAILKALQALDKKKKLDNEIKVLSDNVHEKYGWTLQWGWVVHGLR